MKKIRVQNISALTKPPMGQIIDYHGTVIGRNKFAILSVDFIDQDLERWAQEGLIKITDADSGAALSSPSENAITAGTRLTEVADTYLQEDQMEEEDFDLSAAQEATMPPIQSHKGLMGDTTQDASKARVTLGTREDGFETTVDLSPIPGDRPRSVDESDKFTVKAPRQQHVGGVISTKG